jgi:class 3 adenylate cyclase
MTDQRVRRLAAVWFADIRGYTALSSQDEDAAMKVIEVFQTLSREQVGAHGGRVVKFIGDAVMTVFDSTDAALRAAIGLRTAFAEAEIVRAHRVDLRVGVHLGEVVEAEDGDVYGDGVNTASRVEGAAEPGQVAVSEAVFQQIRNRTHFHTEALGAFRLKGLSEPLPLYSVTLGPPVPGRRPRTPKGDPWRRRVYSRATAIGMTAALGSFALLMFSIASSVGREEGTSTEKDSTVDAIPSLTLPDATTPTASSVLPSSTAPPHVPSAGEADPPDAVAAPAATTWRVHDTIDPIDDSRAVALVLDGSGGARLELRCLSRSSEVVVVWPERLVEGNVTQRRDGGRPRTDRWALSPDSTLTRYRGDARRLIRDWAAADALVLRVVGSRGALTARFAIQGMEEEMTALRGACRW